jgi:hypothetical protein
MRRPLFREEMEELARINKAVEKEKFPNLKGIEERKVFVELRIDVIENIQKL